MEEDGEDGTFDKILGISLFLGLAYMVYRAWKEQQSQQQAQASLLTLESGNDNDNINDNSVSYKEVLGQWQPLDWNPKEDSIKDLKKKLNMAVKNVGGTSNDNKIKMESVQGHQSVPQDTVSQAVLASQSQSTSQSISQSQSTSVVGELAQVQSEQLTLGINSYSNHERWKVVRGLDRRIIGYELIRDANIKSS